MQIILASTNLGKIRELKELSGSMPGLELLSAPDGFNPEETGQTFIENAIIKAHSAALLTGKPAIADDSGLTVDALNGKPGIHSARYCEGSDADRRAKLLKEMISVPQVERGAAFVCAMALVDERGNVLHKVLESWTGSIALAEAGRNGFGYDPIFIPERLNLTAAQLPQQQKNKISHRAKAWSKMLEYLRCMPKSGPEDKETERAI
jgi:XTP/dITP diphosphohydrolase